MARSWSPWKMMAGQVMRSEAVGYVVAFDQALVGVAESLARGPPTWRTTGPDRTRHRG